MNIFIVEDALFLQALLCHAFTERGVKVVGVEDSARSALTKIKALKPDLVYLDLVLPKQNGLDFLQDLNPRSIKTKVIVCSSLPYEQTGLNKKGKGLVANYVQKPFDLEELMSVLDSTALKESEVA